MAINCPPLPSDKSLDEIFSATYNQNILLLRDIFKTLSTFEPSATVTLKVGPEGLTLYKLASSRDVAFRLRLLRKHFVSYKCFCTTEATLNI